MPLRDGTMRKALGETVCLAERKELLTLVVRQMLSALDYLAFTGICHRDVTPDNILDYKSPSGLVFQLADAGRACETKDAVYRSGTQKYMAPVLLLQYGTFRHSPKMDVWSLVATIAYTYPGFSSPGARQQ